MKFKVGDKVKVFGFMEYANNKLATVVIADATGCDVQFDEPVNDILAGLTFSFPNDRLELVPRYHIPPDTSKYSEEGKKILKKVKDIIHQVAQPQFNVGDKVKILDVAREEVRGLIGIIKMNHGNECSVQTLPPDNKLWLVDNDKLELVSVAKPKYFNVASMLEGNSQKREKCKLCKGTGKLLMLNNYVPCDCTK